MTTEEASIKVGKDWFDKHIDTNKIPNNKRAKK